MSRLISVILLSILMFPIAGVGYILTFVCIIEMSRYGPRRDESAFFVAGVAASAFIACYWILLWRKAVTWTTRRLHATWASAVPACIVAVIAGVAGRVVDPSFGVFIGTVVAPLLWVVATIFIWRESASERAARLAGAGSHGVACPTCGYNLTGLKGTRCPECGTEFTLDQLFAQQAEKSQGELEQS